MSLLVAVDVETTGLDPLADCIWDFAAIAVVDGRIVGEFDSLVRPDAARFKRHQREVVKQVSGLDDAGLLNLFDAPDARHVGTKVATWLEPFGGISNASFTSFNVAFDAKFLAVEPWEVGYAMWAPCVMEACCRPMGEAGVLPKAKYGDRWAWPRLTAACEFFGVQFVETHRAKADALAAAKLAIALGLDVAAAPSLTLDLGL